MIDSEIRKFNKSELFDLIVKLSEENGKLKIQNEQLEEKLNTVQIKIDNSGSIAEASAAINGIMETADKTAAEFVENAKQIEIRAEERAQKLIEDTRNKCDDMIKDAEMKVSEARVQCAAMIAAAKKNIDEQWLDLKEKLDHYCEAHESLKNKIVNLNVKDII